MSVTSDAFKQGMRRLCGGVTIVTTREGEQAGGLTATAVCSLSAAPPRLLACINRGGITYRMIAESRVFCVNVLSAGQQDLAACFAGMMNMGERDRFDLGNWTDLGTGAPALVDALAAFDCRVSSIVDTGSHAIIIGDIMEIRTQEPDLPLLYMDGQFLTTTGVEDHSRTTRSAG